MRPPKKAKGPKWSREEDRKLCEYVANNGANNWETVARALGTGRSANSCSQRWRNYLAPGINGGEFTDEERLEILRLRSELGNKWAEIARRLGTNRTGNHVKNFYNSHIKKANADSSPMAQPPQSPAPATNLAAGGDPNVGFSSDAPFEDDNCCAPATNLAAGGDPNVGFSSDVPFEDDIWIDIGYCVNGEWVNP